MTIDNAASGHARKALRALYDNLPQLGGRAAFLERVRNGYRLNEVGLSTTQVIDGFDPRKNCWPCSSASAPTPPVCIRIVAGSAGAR